MHVTVFKPNPESDRWCYWVVLFPDLNEGGPETHYASNSLEAEALAAALAETHGGRWDCMRDLPERFQCFDQHEDLTTIDRVEITNLGTGRGQFNCFSGNVRLSADSGSMKYLLDSLLMTAEDWCDK